MKFIISPFVQCKNYLFYYYGAHLSGRHRWSFITTLQFLEQTLGDLMDG